MACAADTGAICRVTCLQATGSKQSSTPFHPLANSFRKLRARGLSKGGRVMVVIGPQKPFSIKCAPAEAWGAAQGKDHIPSPLANAAKSSSNLLEFQDSLRPYVEPSIYQLLSAVLFPFSLKPFKKPDQYCERSAAYVLRRCRISIGWTPIIYLGVRFGRRRGRWGRLRRVIGRASQSRGQPKAGSWRLRNFACRARCCSSDPL